MIFLNKITIGQPDITMITRLVINHAMVERILLERNFFGYSFDLPFDLPYKLQVTT